MNQNDLEKHEEMNLTNSLLGKESPTKKNTDPFDLLNNKNFQRGMKLIVFILMMFGLMIGKIWITVKLYY